MYDGYRDAIHDLNNLDHTVLDADTPIYNPDGTFKTIMLKTYLKNHLYLKQSNRYKI
jgi:hypothetical protein